MILSGGMMARRGRTAALSIAGLSLILSPTIAAAVECPDQQTVGAARLLEFKTMMMVVGLRCKSVGVIMADHNDEMAGMRSTMFEEANRRVRRYITEGIQSAPVAVAPAPAPAAPLAAAAAQPKARIASRARGNVRGRGPAKGRGHFVAGRPSRASAAAATTKAASPSTSKAHAPGPARATRTVLARPAPAAAKPAARSRREDPYEMYLTRVGTFYGMGDNSLGTCRKYDALVSFLADPTTPNRALTMAADRMVASTILERQRNCTARP